MRIKPFIGEAGRPCVRCGTPMVNIFRCLPDLDVIDLRKILGGIQKPLKTLICPECGEVCFYLEDIPDDIDDIPDKFTK